MTLCMSMWRGMGIKAGDFKKIKAVIDENADIIIAQWNKHFNQ